MKRKKALTEAFSLELRLLLACLGHDISGPRMAEINYLLSQPIDWKRFLQYAQHHRVEPVIFQTLRRMGAPLPDAVFDELKKRYQKNAFRAVMMTGEMLRLVACMAEFDIQSVVLKGPPLAQMLYGDVALRPSNDIDMLVWPENLVAADEALERQGYRRIHPDFPMTSRRWRWCLKKDHHFSYKHGQSGILVELHWRLGHYGMEFSLPAKDKLASCRIAGRDVPVMAKEEELLFLIFHGAKHGWFRLRWLCDIGRLIMQEPDWDEVLEKAERLRIKTMVWQALILAQHLLEVPIPERFVPDLAQDQRAWSLAQMAVLFIEKADYDPSDNILLSDFKMYGLQKRYDYHVRIGWRIKLKWIGYYLNPIEEDIREIALPDSLFSLYYVVRPFTWLKRAVVPGKRGTR